MPSREERTARLRKVSKGASAAFRSFRALRMLRPTRAFEAMRSVPGARLVSSSVLSFAVASLGRTDGPDSPSRVRGRKRAAVRRCFRAAAYSLGSALWLPVSYAVATLRPEGQATAGPTTLATLSNAPANALSRFVGKVAGNQRLPHWAHRQMIRTVIAMYSIDVSEIEGSLDDFQTVQAFFSRKLRPGSRPPHPTALLVSPCDAEVLNVGPVEDGMILQVKGNSFPIEQLLQTELPAPRDPTATKRWFYLFHLRPKDYHRFHAPADISVVEAVHVPGCLHPVTDTAARWIPNLFAVNERVALIGEWSYGPIAVVPVGATCVGSIDLEFDRTIKTNAVSSLRNVASLFRPYPPTTTSAPSITQGDEPVMLMPPHPAAESTTTCPVAKHNVYAPHPPARTDYRSRSTLPALVRGDNFGWFNWGSAIVIVADLPLGVEPCVKRYDEVRVGQALCGPCFS